MAAYGQNKYTGPSSGLPNENPSSNFLPQGYLPTGDNGQTRALPGDNVPAAYGMKSQTLQGTLTGPEYTPARPVTKRVGG